jgi:hypothetical protein
MTTLRPIDYCGFLPDEVAFPEAVASGSRDPHEDFVSAARQLGLGWLIIVLATSAALGVILVLAVRA